MTIAEINKKYANLINKVKDNNKLILDLPYDTMIDFIHKLGITGNIKLYQDLKDVAYEKFGEIVIFHLFHKLGKFQTDESNGY